MNLSHVGSYVRSPRVAKWKKVLGVLGLAFGLIARDMAKHARAPAEAAPPAE